MDSGRPQVVYERYCYDQEANLINQEIHRAEASGDYRNAQPIDSFGSRRMHAIGLSSAIQSVNRNTTVPGPNVGNNQGYGGVNTPNFNSSFMSGRYEGTGHINVNNRDGNFEWNRRNFHVHLRQSLNSFGSGSQRTLAASFHVERQPPNPFESGRQPTGSFGFEGQRPASFDLDFERQSPNAFEFGRRQPTSSFVSEDQRSTSFGASDIGRAHHNSFEFVSQADVPLEFRSEEAMFDTGANDARRCSSSWGRRYYNENDRQPFSVRDFKERQPGLSESRKEPHFSFENRIQGDSHNDFLNDDQLSSRERSKLIFRIKNAYGDDLVNKNKERFDTQDWVTVNFVLSGGLRVYCAKVTCPLCFGNVSLVNRQAEPGRLPQWDLFPIKRHISNLHKKTGVANATITNGQSPVTKCIKTKSFDEEIEKWEEPSEEKITPSENRKDKPSEEKDVQLLKEIESFQEEVIGRVPLEVADTEETNESSTDSSSETFSSESSDDENISSTDSDSDSALPDGKKRKGPTVTKSRKAYGKRKSNDKVGGIKKRKKQKKASEIIEEWKNRDVEYGWIKLTANSRFVPGFIFPKEKGAKYQTAQLIQTNGKLSDLKHPITGSIATEMEAKRARQSRKSANYVRGVNSFNIENRTKYDSEHTK